MNQDAEIKRLKDELERITKLCAVKADMVSVSVHQIRTSLSAMKWIVQMFLSGDLGKLNAEQHNLMQKAFDGNERVLEIVGELLLSNKTENVVEKPYDFIKVDMTELIDSSIFDFSGEAHSRGIEIIFLKPEGHLSDVLADKEKLRVVFQNLLENAVKYSNKSGKIFIAIRKNDDDMLEVSVKDNGVGISEEGKKKIFEKFYRDPEAQKLEVIGSGIGLFTSKKIVEEHKGKIWFESSEDEGTTFFFSIPICK